METLVITIIAAVLCLTNVITPYWFVGIVIVGSIWLFVGPSLYSNFGILKFYYHDLLGWHTPDDSPQSFDGCSQHAKCKYCGKDIMMDSQGNWF